MIMRQRQRRAEIDHSPRGCPLAGDHAHPTSPASAEGSGFSAFWTPVGEHKIYAIAARRAPADRKPVVLVHGVGMSSRYMQPLARSLAKHFPVYAPDLPGYGESFKPRQILDVPALADALYGWTREVGLQRAAFVGNSFGCQIAIELAVRHPDVVDCLVLQGPTVEAKARSFLQQLWRLAVNSSREPSGMGPITRSDYRKAGLQRVLETARLALQDKPETKLLRVSAPTLVVHGGRDAFISESWARHVVDLLPDGRHLVLPDATHTLNFVAPDALAEAIFPFLLEPQARGAR